MGESRRDNEAEGKRCKGHKWKGTEQTKMSGNEIKQEGKNNTGQSKVGGNLKGKMQWRTKRVDCWQVREPKRQRK